MHEMSDPIGDNLRQILFSEKNKRNMVDLLSTDSAKKVIIHSTASSKLCLQRIYNQTVEKQISSRSQSLIQICCTSIYSIVVSDPRFYFNLHCTVILSGRCKAECNLGFYKRTAKALTSV